jgi:two-component system, response regulator YesN
MHIVTMSRPLISLPGLVTTVRLKTDLLRHLSRCSAEEWPEHIDRFIDAVAASELEDAVALGVLLADLTEEIRVLLGQEAVGRPVDQEQATESAFEALARNDMLAEFRTQVSELLTGVVRAGEVVSPLVAQMRSLIEERYAEPLTLDVLAGAFGRSKRYLATLFRHQTGQTVHGFLTQVRVYQATSLIRAGEKIEAISLLVGYRSKKNFYRHFKAQLGVTPTVYRSAVVGLMLPPKAMLRRPLV